MYVKRLCPYSQDAIKLAKSLKKHTDIHYITEPNNTSQCINFLKNKNLISKSSNHNSVPIIFLCYPKGKTKFIGGFDKFKSFLNK